MRSPANALRLLDAMERLEAGEGEAHDLTDVDWRAAGPGPERLGAPGTGPPVVTGGSSSAERLHVAVAAYLAQEGSHAPEASTPTIHGSRRPGRPEGTTVSSAEQLDPWW
jgi:hypothetical protein